MRRKVKWLKQYVETKSGAEVHDTASGSRGKSFRNGSCHRIQALPAEDEVSGV